jgi:hypothetical protein
LDPSPALLVCCPLTLNGQAAAAVPLRQLTTVGFGLCANPPNRKGRPKAHKERKTDVTRFILGVLARLVPTFVLGFVWHLVLFDDCYRALAVYRSDIIIPFGFLSMCSRVSFSPGFMRMPLRSGTGPSDRML